MLTPPPEGECGGNEVGIQGTAWQNRDPGGKRGLHLSGEKTHSTKKEKCVTYYAYYLFTLERKENLEE